MFSSIAIGQYVPGSSLIHRLDPRTKCVLIFIFMILVFLLNNLYSFTLAILYTFVVILCSRLSIRYLWKGLKPIWVILLLTLILHIWMTREGTILFSLGPISIYEEGLRQGGMITLRIFLIVMLTSLLTLTTKPLELTAGVEKLLNPLRKLKFPVHEFAFMVSIALRFIPTLLQETEKIMKAQMARGASLRSGSLWKRMMNLIPILIPLFISSFQRAEDLALAMEARAYRGGEGRTQWRQLCLTKLDYGAIACSVVLFCALIICRSW